MQEKYQCLLFLQVKKIINNKNPKKKDKNYNLN